MNEAFIKEIFSDQDFVQTLLAMETQEEVQAALKEKGVELSTEEILGVKKALASQESGELSEDDLENVAGGIAVLVGGATPLLAAAIDAGIIDPAGKSTFIHMITRTRW